MEDSNLVGPVEDTRIGIEIPEVWLVVVVVVVEETEAEVVCVGRNKVDDDAVFALALGVKG